MDNKPERVTEMSRSDKTAVYLVALPSGELVIQKVLYEMRNADLYLRLQKIGLPCLPKILDVKTSEHETIVLEEYIAGQELDKVLNGSIEKAQGYSYMEQLLKTVCQLHTLTPPVIHRDIKPENILITEEKKVILIDLDAAREWSEEGKEKDTCLLGTRGYAAPEQFGYSQTDIRSDLYSVGIVCRQIGEKMVLSKAEERRLKTFLDKATMFDPKERYQNAEEMLHALQRVFRYSDGKTKKIFLATGICVMITGVSGLVLWQNSERNRVLVERVSVESRQEYIASEELYDFEILPANYRYRGIYARLNSRDDTVQLINQKMPDLVYEVEGAEGFYEEGQECAIGKDFPLLRFLKSSPQAILEYDCKCENQQISSVYLERYSATGSRVLDRITFKTKEECEIRYGFLCLKVEALNRLQEGIYYLKITTYNDAKWEYYLQIHGVDEKVDEFAPRVLGPVQYFSLALENDVFYNVYNTPYKVKAIYCNDMVVPEEVYTLTSDGRGVLFHGVFFQTHSAGETLELRFEMGNYRNAYARAIIIQ